MMHLDVKSTITTNNEIGLFSLPLILLVVESFRLFEEKGLHVFPRIFLFLDLRLCYACNPICYLVPIGFLVLWMALFFYLIGFIRSVYALVAWSSTQ